MARGLVGVSRVRPDESSLPFWDPGLFLPGRGLVGVRRVRPDEILAAFLP
jgi:hypothetical protein